MLAQINGATIYFDVEGAGLVADGHVMIERPACFVLHGGPAYDHSYFKPWLSPLAHSLQLIYVDQRGAGRSSQADRASYTLAQMADDLEALRRHLGLRRVVVLGHSVGGFLALTYALRYPDAVSILIPVATASSYRWQEGTAALIEERGTEEQHDVLEMVVEGKEATDEEYRQWFHTMAPLLHFRAYDPDQVDAMLDRMRANRATEAEMWRSDLARYDLDADLPQIRVPTLVLAGGHDGITNVETVQRVADQIPDAEFHVFEKTGHWIFMEAPEEFASVITRFVENRHE